MARKWVDKYRGSFKRDLRVDWKKGLHDLLDRDWSAFKLLCEDKLAQVPAPAQLATYKLVQKFKKFSPLVTPRAASSCDVSLPVIAAFAFLISAVQAARAAKNPQPDPKPGQTDPVPQTNPKPGQTDEKPPHQPPAQGQHPDDDCKPRPAETGQPEESAPASGGTEGGSGATGGGGGSGSNPPANEDAGQTPTAQVNVIQGTPGDDRLYGTSGDDIIRGGDGDDIIFGRGGNDQLFGEAGDDRLFGEEGDDLLDGGEGGDSLFGGGGNDTLKGGEGNDRLFGETGDDTLLGGAGDDILYGGDGDDILNGGEGNDILYGGLGRDIFVFGRKGGYDKVLDFEEDCDEIRIDCDDDDFIITPTEYGRNYLLDDGSLLEVHSNRGKGSGHSGKREKDYDIDDEIDYSTLAAFNTPEFDYDDEWAELVATGVIDLEDVNHFMPSDYSADWQQDMELPSFLNASPAPFSHEDNNLFG